MYNVPLLNRAIRVLMFFRRADAARAHHDIVLCGEPNITILYHYIIMGSHNEAPLPLLILIAISNNSY